MDFYKALDTDSSRAVAEYVTEAVGNNQIYFKKVLDLALQDIPKVSARAGRVVFLCTEKYPKLLDSYIHEIIKKIPALKNKGTIRTILKLVTLYPNLDDEDELSILLECCFKYLNGDYSIAEKVYGMEIIYNISKQYPEILNELREVVKAQLQYSSAGFKARAKILLGIE